MSRDFTCQSKSSKCIESFKPFNRRWKLNRGSSYNTLFEDDDDKTFKDVETKLESDPNLGLKFFIYVIKNFDLDDSKSNCFIGSLSFRNSVENFETEGGYLTAFNRLKKLLKRPSNKLNILLYDTGTIDYIVNDRKWFKDVYVLNRGQLKILKIGGDFIIPKGNSTAVFTIVF